ncbi:hypothetical protein TrLO_g12090 [Triparma laevis f. longispina]|uniref:Uncharacterized protein n=1 Tax=Triparma laevis f. longispina TaxID=1714387 RepID=A0A9W7FPC0_9STRA|nr:hypothetical protein TrLO_g12090 [Triparma laevis f. longispina]
MKGSFSNRDYILEGFEGRGEDGGWYFARRSIKSKKMYSLKRSRNSGLVRAKVLCERWVLHDLGAVNRVRVTYLENVDPGGLFKGGFRRSANKTELTPNPQEFLRGRANRSPRNTLAFY